MLNQLQKQSSCRKMLHSPKWVRSSSNRVAERLVVTVEHLKDEVVADSLSFEKVQKKYEVIEPSYIFEHLQTKEPLILSVQEVQNGKLSMRDYQLLGILKQRTNCKFQSIITVNSQWFFDSARNKYPTVSVDRVKTIDAAKNQIYHCLASRQVKNIVNPHYQLKQGDIFRLAQAIHFKVLDIRLQGQQQLQEKQGYDFAVKINGSSSQEGLTHMYQDHEEEGTCRICLSSDSGGSSREERNQEDFLMSPCSCKGSCVSVHLMCLRTWLKQKVRVHQKINLNHGTISISAYYFRKYYCEICKSELPKIITKKGSIYPLLQKFKLPKLPYLALWAGICDYEEQIIIIQPNISENQGSHVSGNYSLRRQTRFSNLYEPIGFPSHNQFQYSHGNNSSSTGYSVNFGRSYESNVFLPHPTLSHKHSQISFINDNTDKTGFYLRDLNSISGTYLKINQPLPIDSHLILEQENTKIDLQKQTRTFKPILGARK